MNKTQLIDALAARIGDRRIAATAVDGLLSTIVETVQAGESVSLSGFGVFESRARAARVGRNPRTGETVAVPAATVPAFRPGIAFRAAVSGDAPAPPTPPVAVAAPAKPTKAKAAPKTKPAAKTKLAAKSAAKSAAASAKPAAKSTAKSATKSAKPAAATKAAATKPKKKAKK